MLRMEHQQEVEYAQMMRECEGRVDVVVAEKTSLERMMLEIQDAYNKLVIEKSETTAAKIIEIADLKRMHETNMEEALSKQEAALMSQMSQIRVQNAIHLNNVDKKHKKEVEDALAAHALQMAQLRTEMDMVMIRAKKVGDIERKAEAEQMALQFRYDVQEIHSDNAQKIKDEIEMAEERHRVWVSFDDSRKRFWKWRIRV